MDENKPEIDWRDELRAAFDQLGKDFFAEHKRAVAEAKAEAYEDAAKIVYADCPQGLCKHCKPIVDAIRARAKEVAG
jgi:hypothetical protein